MVSQYQSVSILDVIGAKDDEGGGDNWSHKTCKAPVKMSPPTNQHPVSYRPDHPCVKSKTPCSKPVQVDSPAADQTTER